jgi:hypothetical protein
MPNLSTNDFSRLLQKNGLARTSDGQLYPPPFNVSAKTADYTIKANDACGTLFTNRGATGTVVLTLPAPTAVPSGTFYYVLAIAAQTVTVATATADTLVSKNDAAGDSLTLSTSMEIIGGLMVFICDGTAWAGAGLSVGHTFTLAT